MYEVSGISGFCSRLNCLMGRAGKWTYFDLDLKILIRSFDSLHVITRINFMMTGGLHGWTGLYPFDKNRLSVYIPTITGKAIWSLFTSVLGFFPTCPIKRLDLTQVSFLFKSLKVISSLMGGLFKENDWYKESSRGVSVGLYHIKYLGLS